MLAKLLIFLAISAAAAAAGGLWLGRVARRLLPGRGRALLILASRLIPAAVFLAAAYGKLRDPYAFAVSVYAYRVLPASLATVFAVVTPAIEVIAALALATGRLWRGGAIVIGGLLLVFIAGLAQAILRGIDIDCGCFGKGSSPVSFWLIARNYGLLLLALFPLAVERARRGLSASPARRDSRPSSPPRP
jgi:putative oxidoreductase